MNHSFLDPEVNSASDGMPNDTWDTNTMTTDSFILRLLKILEKKDKEAQYTEELVREVLEQHHIIDLLQQSASTSTPNTLTVHRLLVSGYKQRPGADDTVEFRYDRSLQSGINAWVGDNGTGKSSVLKLITWALTGTDPKLKGDVLSWIRDVAVEFEINGLLFLIRFFPLTGQSNLFGHIYAGTIDMLLNDHTSLRLLRAFYDQHTMTEAISEFFSARLGFVELDWAGVVRATLSIRRSTISWDTYSQVLLIGSDDASDYLFSHSGAISNQHEKTLSMYLGLGMEKAISSLEAETTQLRSFHRFEVKRVRENTRDVEKRIETLQIEENLTSERIRRLEQAQSTIVDTEVIDQIQSQIAEATAKIVQLTEVEQTCQEEIPKVEGDRKKAERAIRDLRASIQFKIFLSGLEVERCPRCEERLPATTIEDEIQMGTCHVCHSELKPASSTDQYEELLEHYKKKKKDLESERGKLQKEVIAIQAASQQMKQRREELQKELRDLPRQELAGLGAELRQLLSRKGYLRGQIENLEEQTHARQQQRLDALRREVEVLTESSRLLRSMVRRSNSEILHSLSDLTTALALQLHISNFEKAELRDHLELWVRQSGKWLRFSGLEQSEMLRVKIAFHLALLILRIEQGVGRHPAFLMFDAPGGADMDANRFLDVIRAFGSVKERLGSKAQILIASARPGVDEVCDPGALMTPAMGGRFF